jgi:transposase
LGISERTIEHLKKRYINQGLAAFEPVQRTRRKERKFDGKLEAHLIATACSPAPEGRTRWTLSLLSQKMVELKIVDAISNSTVQRTLKKTNSVRI